MADETFPHLDGERDELAVLRAQAITLARYLVHRIDHDEARDVAEDLVKAHVWTAHDGEHEHRNGRCTRCGAVFTGADLLDAIDKCHAEGGTLGWDDAEDTESALVRDEEIALAQWQRKRIAELEVAVALLTGERDGALDLLIARRMERDDAREALRHAEEQLETERQRVERLMAVERAARRVVESWPHDTSLHAAIGALRIDLEATDGE